MNGMGTKEMQDDISTGKEKGKETQGSGRDEKRNNASARGSRSEERGGRKGNR